MESDSELLRLVADGSERAMKALYMRHHDLVYGFVRRQLRDEPNVEDAVQDVFIAVFRTPLAFQGTSAFGTYLCSIAKMKVIDRFRDRERERSIMVEGVAEEDLAFIPDETDIGDVLLQVGRRQALTFIEACMERLPEVQREALFWTYFQDERDHEVAARQEVSQGTVKSRLNAARLALKRCLSQRARGGLYV